MAYQSSTTTGGRPPVQESYGGTNDDDLLSSSNIGLPNSARGDGTTTSEISAKLRFFNCAVCAYLLLFHSFPIVMNPVRLALLLKSPVRLLLEAIVGIVALSMLVTEAQVPLLAEKILVLFRKFSVGNVQLVDLDVARGRFVAIVIMTLAMGMMNHLNSHYSHDNSNSNDNNTVDPTVVVDDDGGNGVNSTVAMNETIVNIDNATTSTLDPTTFTYNNSNNSNNSDNHNAIIGFLLAIINSTIFSLAMWILLALLIYTLYVIREYPSYAEYRVFPNLQNGSNSSGEGRPTLSSASGRSWVSNIPDFSSIRGAAGSGGGGYQSVDNPIQMNV